MRFRHFEAATRFLSSDLWRRFLVLFSSGCAIGRPRALVVSRLDCRRVFGEYLTALSVDGNCIVEFVGADVSFFDFALLLFCSLGISPGESTPDGVVRLAMLYGLVEGWVTGSDGL